MAAVHESTNSSLNERCQFVDQGPRLARSKGYGGFLSRALIGEQTARVTLTGERHSGWWLGRSTVAAHQSLPHMALQTSVFNEVLAYGTAATWESRFAYLRAVACDGGCWHPGGGSAKTQTR
jgi:hypothetical protein